MDNNHPQVNFGKTGVLLINLGTPDSTGWWDIRKYLNEFLSDRRVIEVNPFLWKIILSDNKSDVYESNLMRRICGLLYLPDKLSGEIKLDIIRKNKNDVHS